MHRLPSGVDKHHVQPSHGRSSRAVAAWVVGAIVVQVSAMEVACGVGMRALVPSVAPAHRRRQESPPTTNRRGKVPEQGGLPTGRPPCGDRVAVAWHCRASEVADTTRARNERGLRLPASMCCRPRGSAFGLIDERPANADERIGLRNQLDDDRPPDVVSQLKSRRHRICDCRHQTPCDLGAIGTTECAGADAETHLRRHVIVNFASYRPATRGHTELRELDLAPRHLSLLAHLQYDGELSISELAARLEVAPTTISLMVAELSHRGILDRREDDHDKRRRIVAITSEMEGPIAEWLSGSARAWLAALEPLDDTQREIVVRTLQAYEMALDVGQGAGQTGGG